MFLRGPGEHSSEAGPDLQFAGGLLALGTSEMSPFLVTGLLTNQSLPGLVNKP
jgi:hypothetical protein